MEVIADSLKLYSKTPFCSFDTVDLSHFLWFQLPFLLVVLLS